MYAIRIDGKVFTKNCTHIITKGRIHTWRGVQNGAMDVREEMELSIFPWAGKKVFRVYQHGQTTPEYWLIGE